ncbi:hypothetical protein N8787_00765 [Opitutaceae bacterium]|nr:hypothetical protein [Opitutaceae bacterium]
MNFLTTMTNKSKRNTKINVLDESAKTTLLQRIVPEFSERQATLIVYNTVARLLSGDLHHTVSIEDVWKDLFFFPADWLVLGIGTTNFLHRNGEMMPDGTTHHLHFWWADPQTAPQSHVIDLAEKPNAADKKSTSLVKGLVEFPFLALSVCDPHTATTHTISDVANLHQWLEEKLTDLDMTVAGIQIKANCGNVTTTDAHYIPEDGLDLSGGYSGDDFFYRADHKGGTWIMNGIYTNDASLIPFITLADNPVHLHGYQQDLVSGGHIVNADIISAQVSFYPMKDVILKIHNI